MESVPPFEKTKFHEIGHGACGSVWAPPLESTGDTSAFKRGDGGRARCLTNDYRMHHRVERSLDAFQALMDPENEGLPLQIHVPRCRQLIGPDDAAWWSANRARFPAGYLPCQVLESERIRPIARRIRERLVDEYAPEGAREQIKSSAANECCLLHPYLGRPRRGLDAGASDEGPVGRPRARFFSLRNFPLHRDRMRSLGLADDAIAAHARTTAQTLAMVHWLAEADAGDVEFVIASPRELGQAGMADDGALGEHVLWLLDFDLCRAMDVTDGGVRQAVRAFFQNDLYCPRPGLPLWHEFRTTYVDTSCFISNKQGERGDGSRAQLAAAFMEGVEREQEALERRRGESSKVEGM